MKETPLLMNQSSMAAYLAGRKWQTRRPCKLPPALKKIGGDLSKAWVDGVRDGAEYLKVPCPKDSVGEPTVMSLMCPFGEPGDAELYFRETFYIAHVNTWAGLPKTINPKRPDEAAYYKAGFDRSPPKWQPSIFMPKRLARFFVPLTKVRVRRVQDISEDDVKAEGVQMPPTELFPMMNTGDKLKRIFAVLWDNIHGKKPEFCWKANPFVWCLSFPKYEAKETT